MMRMSMFTCLVALVAACSSSSGPPPEGTGGSGGDSGIQCQVDAANAPGKAVPLVEGSPATGYVCPPRDEDWFRFDVAADKPIVEVSLAYSDQAVSAVELAYSIYASDGTTSVPGTGAADTVTTDNHSSVHKRERLVAGTYYLKVYDFGGEDQDPRSAYTLSIVGSADVDANEPNDDCAHATPLTAGAGQGAISFGGDQDAFAISAPGGSQVIDVKVTSQSALGLRLKGTFLDAGGKELTNGISDSTSAAASLHISQAVLGAASTYCLLLGDVDGTAFSDRTYSVQVAVSAELDPNEQVTRNDTPATATAVPAGGKTFTGYIGSIGDVDWYKVTNPGGVNPILELDLDCPGCQLQTTFSLVAPHDGTPCDASTKCDYLVGAKSCLVNTDCGDNACGETSSGGKCALSCDPMESGLECPGFQCTTTGTMTGACAGSGVCTPEQKCGALQYTEVAPADSNHIRTAQPFHSAVIYVSVRDFHDDETSAQPYTLKLDTYADPDPDEPNNFYYPYPENPHVLDSSGPLATQLAVTRVPADTTLPAVEFTWSGSGCIAYEGDIDMFHLVDSASGKTCGAGLNCAMSIDFDKPATPLDLVYFLNNGTSTARASFRVKGQPDGTFGNNTCGDGSSECVTYYHGDSGDDFLIVRHFGQDDWDKDPSHCYHFTVHASATPGCPASCPTVGKQKGLCTCTL